MSTEYWEYGCEDKKDAQLKKEIPGARTIRSSMNGQLEASRTLQEEQLQKVGKRVWMQDI